eukprot:CAMPEP_0119103796 /NCGR_PEP_ID=MMETSP1180-20130426/2163_1 /TAXON_ID=3052 ORGANISM="Chlamydomonas cf sp, Strain CCMP681" /NCGR_SAMPLE_ID=MMETSP1180 /ASSEMBLY_ACC=CAM_ASM_000741 /LENGTH=57 /DNA_ID=CAMNT_0007088389 /DNA_START=681 /DNA_END=854 /DNA_ORIENTATION=+
MGSNALIRLAALLTGAGNSCNHLHGWPTQETREMTAGGSGVQLADWCNPAVLDPAPV